MLPAVDQCLATPLRRRAMPGWPTTPPVGCTAAIPDRSHLRHLIDSRSSGTPRPTGIKRSRAGNQAKRELASRLTGTTS